MTTFVFENKSRMNLSHKSNAKIAQIKYKLIKNIIYYIYIYIYIYI